MDADGARWVRVTHPFHPLRGQRIELLSHRHDWGEQRVHFRDGAGRLRSLPAAWTDAVPPDPFVALADGRALWRVGDLLALVAVARELAPRLYLERGARPRRGGRVDRPGSIGPRAPRVNPLADVQPVESRRMAEEERDRRAAARRARRARRAAYFRAYYGQHREAILAKNRRWYEEHQARATGRPRTPARCVDSWVAMVRGEPCERCRTRYRYHTDREYRARHLATAGLWWARTRPPPRREEDAR